MLTRFYKAKIKYPEKINDLRLLLSNNPRQILYPDSISFLIERKVSSQKFIIHLKRSDNFYFGYIKLLDESSALIDVIKLIAAKMKMEEERWRIYRSLEGNDSIINTKIISIIFSITGVIVLLMSLIYILVEIKSKRKVKDLLDPVLQASQSAILSFRALRQTDGRINDFVCVHANRIAT